MSRIGLTADTTFYVSPLTGNDAHDGSYSSPWRTVQHAANYIRNKLDCAGFTPTIQLLGSVTEQVEVAGALMGAVLMVIRGDSTTPANCTWTAARCLSTRDFGVVLVEGFKFIPGQYGRALVSAQNGIIDWRNCDFGDCPDGVHVEIDDKGDGNATGPYTVSGNACFHIHVRGNSHVSIGSPTHLPNALTFSGAFAAATYNGYLTTCGQNISFTGAGAGAGSSGARKLEAVGGCMSLAGTTFPGNHS